MSLLSKPCMYFPRPTIRECWRTSNSPAFFASGDPCNSDYEVSIRNWKRNGLNSRFGTHYLHRNESSVECTGQNRASDSLWEHGWHCGFMEVKRLLCDHRTGSLRLVVTRLASFISVTDDISSTEEPDPEIRRCGIKSTYNLPRHGITFHYWITLQ